MSDLRSADFDYRLPPELIAQRPAASGHSRLLVLDGEQPPRDRGIADLPALLCPGDLLVVNDTRVIPARLIGRRLPGGGRAELLLLEAVDDPRAWAALMRPAKRLPAGTELLFGDGDGDALRATVLERGAEGRGTVRFDADPHHALERWGRVPLPPYIRRAEGEDPADREDYQTVFARHPGAVAAPTAGLHFNHDLLAALEARGVARAAVTLHVGLGTFKPVSAERVDDHTMERERYRVPAATAAAIAAARRRGARVVAVGTTVVRTLETAAADDGTVRAGSGTSALFIRPGYRFRAVDALVTNFHLPRSTLLMLVCALAGRRRVLDAYAHAVAAGYRFYSYGDAMLITGTLPGRKS